MNPAVNLRKKITYGIIIVCIFAVMFPYSLWLSAVKKEPRPGRSRDRPDRYGQLHDEAVSPGRLSRHRRRPSLDPRRRAEERPRLGPAQDDRRADHQASAPLPLDLDFPGVEPGLQRLGRVGRPRRQVHLDQSRGSSSCRTGSRRTSSRPTWSGIPPGSIITSSASPTNRSSCGACSTTTRKRISRPMTTRKASLVDRR